MNTVEIPKVFWKYYDLFRRKILTFEEFQCLTGLSKETIINILNTVDTRAADDPY